jgi:hypothetical protein
MIFITSGGNKKVGVPKNFRLKKLLFSTPEFSSNIAYECQASFISGDKATTSSKRKKVRLLLYVSTN